MKQKRTIIGIIICIIIFVVLLVILCNQNLKNLFASAKEVNNIVDFNQCQENDFIKIKVSKAYETDYNYLENRTRSSSLCRY